MATASFTYGLHDNSSSYERAERIMAQVPELAAMDVDDVAELVGRPFYEVTLDCDIDLVTGEITINTVNGQLVLPAAPA